MKYRTKSVTIEANELEKHRFIAMAKWCGENCLQIGRSYLVLHVFDSKRRQYPKVGDFILKDAKGNLSRMKPEEFHRTFVLA